eukprot:m.116449 g.116449  ORF g.116449 m.116449 type:complete len:73 (-) comp13611_c0_seq1:69-287(-)
MAREHCVGVGNTLRHKNIKTDKNCNQVTMQTTKKGPIGGERCNLATRKQRKHQSEPITYMLLIPTITHKLRA